MTFKYDRLMSECLLDLQFKSGSGLVVQDSAKPHHPMTLTGPPTWTQLSSRKNVLDFNSGNPDFIRCLSADSVDLGFTTEEFTLASWMNADSLQTGYLMARGSTGPGGWGVRTVNTGAIRFFTANLTNDKITLSDADSYSANEWYFIVVTKSGTIAKIYSNGLNRTESTEAHNDPTSGATDLFVGVFTLAGSTPFDGQMGSVRIWDKALTKSEIRLIFERERHLYGV